MNTSTFLGVSLLGLVPFAIVPVQQDVVLTDPNAAAQSARAPGVDTTVQVYEVNDIIAKLSPSAGEISERDAKRLQLEQKLKRFLESQGEIRQRADGGLVGSREEAVKKVAAEHVLAPTRDYADLIQRYMKPAFEADRQTLTVPSEGLIVGTLRAEQHAWLTSFLDLQKRTSGMVELSVTVYEGPKGAFRDAGLVEASNVFDAPAALAAVRARIRADKRVVEISSPKIGALNAQKASLSILNQVSYVKDWKVTLVEPGPQEIADPTVEVLNEGFVVSLRATALEMNLYGLDLAFEFSKLERPMQTRKMRISATSDREVEIGLPLVTRINFESKLILADGASAAFTTASPEKDRDIAIVLTLKHRALVQTEEK